LTFKQVTFDDFSSLRAVNNNAANKSVISWQVPTTPFNGIFAAYVMIAPYLF